MRADQFGATVNKTNRCVFFLVFICTPHMDNGFDGRAAAIMYPFIIVIIHISYSFKCVPCAFSIHKYIHIIKMIDNFFLVILLFQKVK